MDTLEIYVKMCEKAVKIQKEWKPNPGDFIFRKFTIFGEEIDREIWPEEQSWEINIVWWKSQVESYWACTNEKGESRTYKHPADMSRETSIWLPRQDQLQAIIEDKTRSAWYLVEQFAIWCKFQRKDIAFGFASMEQLWLAFVIKEKYGKIWNGKDWIKEEI